jgi:hypothetical protein
VLGCSRSGGDCECHTWSGVKYYIANNKLMAQSIILVFFREERVSFSHSNTVYKSSSTKERTSAGTCPNQRLFKTEDLDNLESSWAA